MSVVPPDSANKISWLKPTVGIASKRRKKAGSMANFFETMADDSHETTAERLSAIKKIYVTSEPYAQLPEIQYNSFS